MALSVFSCPRSLFKGRGVENSFLRAHWTDNQLRRRDGVEKHQANFEDDYIDDEPVEWAEEYFQDWSQGFRRDSGVESELRLHI